MAFNSLVAADLDLNSPLSELQMTKIKANEDHLKNAITDGASAPQTINASSITAAASGVSVTVTNNGLCSGNLTAAFLATSKIFYRPEHPLHFVGF